MARGLAPGSLSTMPHTTNTTDRTTRTIAWGGVLGAVGYGGLKALWGAGSTLGVGNLEHWHQVDANFGHGLGDWLALQGTSILAAIAAAILLALVHAPLGRRATRALRILAWLGAAVLVVPALGGVATTLMEMTHITQPSTNDMHDALPATTFLFVYTCFTVLAAAFTLVAWRTRPSRVATTQLVTPCPVPQVARSGGTAPSRVVT